MMPPGWRLRADLPLACSQLALDTDGDALVPLMSLASQLVALGDRGCVSHGIANTGEKQHLQDSLMLHTVSFTSS